MVFPTSAINLFHIIFITNIAYKVEKRDIGMGEAEGYWKHILNGYEIDKQLQLPYNNKITTTGRSGQRSSVTLEFDQKLVDRMLTYAQESRVSMFQLGLTIYYVFLFKLTNGEKDLCIGTINRQVSQNLMPCRFKLNPTLPFNQLLLQVQQLCQKILQFSSLHCQETICLHGQEQSFFSSIIQTTFEFGSLIVGEFVYLDNTTIVCEDDNSNYLSKFDVTLSMNYNHQNATMCCSFEYACDLFDAATIQEMMKRFQTLLQQLFLSSFSLEKQSVYQLSILLPNEINLLEDINQTNVNFDNEIKCIHHEFFKKAIEQPQKVAIILDEQSLTYGEILYYIQHLSMHLMRKYCINPGEIICQCVERSIEMVIGILVIQTCGASYCSLSPEDPYIRIYNLIKETKARIVLVHKQSQNKFNDLINNNGSFSIIDIEQIIHNEIIYKEELNLLSNVHVTIKNIAYVIFTSGSTGKPKAVQICHRNFVSYTNSILYLDIMNGNDVVLQRASCLWDVHLHEILSSIIVGATLVMLQQDLHRDIDYLSYVIQNKQITHVTVVPTILITLFEYLQSKTRFDRIKTVRIFRCSGEALLSHVVSKWVPYLPSQCQMINFYGPTESTLVATYHRIISEDLATQSISIGRPLPNYQCYILDEHLQSVVIGKVGEIFIGGSGVFAGYLNRDNLTEQCLISLPGIEEKCYRTGDLAYYNHEGDIYFLGRADFQIKLRGI
ncbi:unnamed protein product [Didymodactylos carnosus]|uniref:AMP-dependent synthetase/ligase domain-containing protein n=1 Tax=Didymodactylos carnosus TaxID=1234261 RepID=A0A815DEZ8_9BILA|nr:unnamed protein product [Didymodactylos carnosus]CAF4124214.1 unnamed protein product [Didymodactylos carnosus]